MITKTYYISTIGITQIINITLNPNLYFPILKQIHQIGPKRLEINQMDRLDRSELNMTELTEVDQIDRSGPNRLNWTKQTELTQLD